MDIKIEKNVPIRYGKIYETRPAAIAQKISSMQIGDSFLIDDEWRSRIYTACWKNRPLRVTISKEGRNSIRVWRVE